MRRFLYGWLPYFGVGMFAGAIGVEWWQFLSVGIALFLAEDFAEGNS